ncbi:MAG: prephenate dehydrogenase [Anaerolineales bacterium]|nr:prephenate dehydrogenase [Anaerolineales bacterium]
MAYEILLIGLDQVGASIGMALNDAEGDVDLVGYDPDRPLSKRAEKAGAVDRLVSHPRKSITSADLVIFSLPIDEVEVYLEHLGAKTKEGAVILDTAQVKVPFFKWAEEYLPEGRSYIGATPIVGPSSLTGGDATSDEPSADLYADGLLAIIAPPNASESAMAVAINLASILKAAPFFIDLHEHDATLASTVELPVLLSAALLQAAAHSTSWKELQRVAGRNFAHATSLCSTIPLTVFEKRLILNRQKVLDKLDQFIQELHDLREVLAEEDGPGISDYLKEADRAHQSWIRAREQNDWASAELRPAERITSAGIFANLLGFRRAKPSEGK